MKIQFVCWNTLQIHSNGTIMFNQFACQIVSIQKELVIQPRVWKYQCKPRGSFLPAQSPRRLVCDGQKWAVIRNIQQYRLYWPSGWIEEYHPVSTALFFKTLISFQFRKWCSRRIWSYSNRIRLLSQFPQLWSRFANLRSRTRFDFWSWITL